jgi:hypothetical protein
VWTLPAEEMLSVPDVGIVPWVPLMHHDGPPEPLLRRCRERIDREGGDKRPNLLAVTQVLMRLKFVQPSFFELFGGERAMIESPYFQGFLDRKERETRQLDIEETILVRFGKLSDDARARLQGVTEEAKLRDLLRFAAICLSLEAFVERLTKETTPSPTPVSSRRKRKS